MQPHLFDGIVVNTTTGSRTIHVTHTQMLPHGSGTCHINFCLVEEPSSAYGLEVFEGFLGDREQLAELLSRWLSGDPPVGSVLKLKTAHFLGKQLG